MNKKWVALVLCAAMAVGTFSGCGDLEISSGFTVDKDDEETTSKETSGTETPGQESDNAGSSDSADAPEETGGNDMAISGGSPWICSEIKENVSGDMETSPKEDFHLYINRDWILENEIPEGNSFFSGFQEASDTVRDRAMSVLTDESLAGHDAELVRSLYNAYMDWDSRNSAGIEPVMDAIEEIQGIKSLDELSAYLCDPEKNLINNMMKWENGASYDDARYYILKLQTGFLTLSDAAEYGDRTEGGERDYESKLSLAKAMLKRLGVEEKEAQEKFDGMIGFEGKLAEVMFTQADQMSPGYMGKINNVYEREKLDELSPVFPLSRMVQEWGYGSAEKLMIPEPKAIERFNELYTEDNLETMKDWVLLHFLSSAAPLLDKEAYDAVVKKNNISNGSSGSEAYEKVVFENLKSDIREPLDRAYLQKYDSSQMKETITGICEEVRNAYKEMLSGEDWLSDETKAKAIEKLDAMRINAIYPDKWIGYDDLDLSGLSLIECKKAIKRFDRKIDAAKTNGEVDKEIWIGYSTLEGNAFYNPQDNSINILIGLLADPFYDDGMSRAEILGSIGTVIGHEISHAFDTTGARFDKDGNMSNWWTDEDLASFNERAGKLVSYYDGITVWEGQNAMGSILQGEVIADMGGVKVMLKLAEGEDGFDYDAFFKSYARMWHRICTREFEYWNLTQDPHPFQYLRTNVTLQQFDEFNKAYDIKEGDNMYLAPADRVMVW